MNKPKIEPDADECCPFCDTLKKDPVKSNGLSKLMEATSDLNQKDSYSGMTPPKANNPQVSR